MDGGGVGAGTSSLAGEGGKSRGKIWNCVVLPPVTSDPEANDETAPTEALTTSRRASRGKYKLERDLGELERQRTARELSASAESAGAAVFHAHSTLRFTLPTSTIHECCHPYPAADYELHHLKWQPL